MHAEPKVFGSILAINRDTRFSADKTHLELWFWQGGAGQSRERPGNFFRLTPESLILGAGMPSDHPRADWLRHSGLFAQIEQPIPGELYTPVLADFCMATCTRLAPLQEWLVKLLPA
jgi:uncharacterized protein (DUF2461 family)